MHLYFFEKRPKNYYPHWTKKWSNFIFLWSNPSNTHSASCIPQHVWILHNDSYFPIYDKNSEFEVVVMIPISLFITKIQNLKWGCKTFWRVLYIASYTWPIGSVAVALKGFLASNTSHLVTNILLLKTAVAKCLSM